MDTEAAQTTDSPAVATPDSGVSRSGVLVQPWWVLYPWDYEGYGSAFCVRCGHTMYLRDGCEWDEEEAQWNLWDACAGIVMREVWKRLNSALLRYGGAPNK